MITSADVRDYMDGLLWEMREACEGHLFLDVSGIVHKNSTTLIAWNSYSKETGRSPSFDSAEAAVKWFKDHLPGAPEKLRATAQELQLESARLLKLAQELETKTPNEAQT